MRSQIEGRGLRGRPLDVCPPTVLRTGQSRDRNNGGDADRVRRKDLDEAPVGEVTQPRRRSSLKIRAHVRIAQTKCTKKKEQLDAEEARNRDENERTRIEPRNLPQMKPDHERNRDSPQTIEYI